MTEKKLKNYQNICIVDDENTFVNNYVNDITIEVKDKLTDNKINVIVLGNGTKIIGQYPSSGVTLYKDDTIVLLTNNYDKKMINFIGMSHKDANNILKLMNVEYSMDGYGYVYEQSIKDGTLIDKEVVLKLKGKY